TPYAQCKDALRREVEVRPDSAWVRLFYQYGPGEDERRLMPAVMLAQLRQQPSKVSKGEERLDYLYIEDVASAIRQVAESRLQGCVNVGSGLAPSVRSMVTKMSELGGRPDLIQWGAYQRRPTDPMLVQADTSKLR